MRRTPSPGLKARPGRLEEADGGSIFLEEIGELPLNLQDRLVRFLQEIGDPASGQQPHPEGGCPPPGRHLPGAGRRGPGHLLPGRPLLSLEPWFGPHPALAGAAAGHPSSTRPLPGQGFQRKWPPVLSNPRGPGSSSGLCLARQCAGNGKPGGTPGYGGCGPRNRS